MVVMCPKMLGTCRGLGTTRLLGSDNIIIKVPPVNGLVSPLIPWHARLPDIMSALLGGGSVNVLHA